MAISTAVVGHVEWVTFARVDHVPAPGEIVHADDVFELPAGGGPVAAVQLAKLAGSCTFFTALGDDELGHRALAELSELGLHVEAVFRPEPQRRAFTHVDAAGERTITVMGPRLGPRSDDPLPWDELDDVDAVYFCAGDDDSLRQARRAKKLVATTREAERLARARVQLDAVAGSGRDPAERYIEIDPPPKLIVETAGGSGGRYRTIDGHEGTYAAAPSRSPVVCAYGAGDSFVAGLAFGLGAGYDVDRALALAADCGASVVTGRGPYAAQLTRERL
ncbi:MAG: PfkB family carbohydrate kinase [Actinomycetota bacterium]